MVARIYLDANALEKQWPGVSGELQILAGLSVLTGTELCIPRSVLIEHENSTIRRIGEYIDKTMKPIAEANSRLRGIHEPLTLPRPDVETLRQSYAAAVALAERYYRIQVVPTSSLSVEEFIRRAAQHRPPFKDEDRGFRDAVHLQSAIDHLHAKPPREGDAYFMSADSRLTAADTLAAVEEAGSPLKFLMTLRAGLDLVRADLPRPTDEFFARLGLVWTPLLIRHETQHLLPQVLRNLRGVGIGSATILAVNRGFKFVPEAGTMVVGPPREGEKSYPLSHEVRVTASALGTKDNAQIKGASWSGTVTLLLSIDATVEAGPDHELLDVTYRSARVFAAGWSSQRETVDFENLPESVELIGSDAGDGTR